MGEAMCGTRASTRECAIMAQGRRTIIRAAKDHRDHCDAQAGCQLFLRLQVRCGVSRIEEAGGSSPRRRRSRGDNSRSLRVAATRVSGSGSPVDDQKRRRVAGGLVQSQPLLAHFHSCREVAEPVGAGLVTSLAKPGGNITGTSLMATDTAAKRLQFLKEVVPTARRVAVLGNLRSASVARSWEETQEAAERLGLKLFTAVTSTPADVLAAFAAIARERPDALVVILDSLMVDHRRQVVEFAAQH